MEKKLLKLELEYLGKYGVVGIIVEKKNGKKVIVFLTTNPIDASLNIPKKIFGYDIDIRNSSPISMLKNEVISGKNDKNTINRFSNNHAGEQPVRVLQFNITKQFETTNPTFLELSRKIIAQSGLNPGISYYINNLPIIEVVEGHRQIPYVKNNKITIHETFLSYIWCVSYSLIVLYEEAVAKPSQNVFAMKEVYRIDEGKINNTLGLFNYGLSLIKSFTTWDKLKFPNPELYELNDEFWVERANGIFIYALNFILCHEFAHIELQHSEKKKSKNFHPIQKIGFEKEADERAFELMLMGENIENAASIKFGIIIGLCSLLFFKKEVSGKGTHPDTDDRIDSFLRKIKPDPSDGIWGVCALSYKLWDEEFLINFDWPKEINDMRELYWFIKKQIEIKK